ncbi:MAG: sigma-E processing peptidase SpoIIGA [Clostridiales bacterium]|nr:sigma-E processing peptidase SpoIIGA [Clostridiales bacterium]
MQIYLDEIFLINFAMDSFIFYLSGRMALIKRPLKQIFFGGAVSSALACLATIVGYTGAGAHLILSFVILAAGLLASFSPLKNRELPRLILYAFAASFCAGGLAFALLFLFYGPQALLEVHYFPIKLLFASCATIYVGLKIWTERWGGFSKKDRPICRMEVFYRDRSIVVNALIDSGNSLKDMLTGMPAAIISPEDGAAFFDGEIRELIRSGRCPPETMAQLGLRLIPYSAVGVKSGIMAGFIPQKAVFTFTDMKIKIVTKMIVGISSVPIHCSGGAAAIINPDILDA